ncbi:Trehalose-6-phosphate synthase [bacterium HR10]|nr:Trehalose-6-phosphate synthase [bacterium HR10]
MVDTNLCRARLLVVSNRSPYSFRHIGRRWRPERAIGGLVAAVEPVLHRLGGLWIAWGDRPVAGSEKMPAPPDDPRYQIKFVPLSSEEVDGYYFGFANDALWPLCHYFLGKCNFSREHWQSYRNVNRKFAAATLEELAAGDIVWVHDYHLALVPQYIREREPSAKIAYFWHIPFPGVDLFRALPWRREILWGLLNSDFVGFHTETYVRNFLDCVEELAKIPVDREQGRVIVDGRRVKVRAVPLGVDVGYCQRLANSPDMQAKARAIRQALRSEIIALGVERLDYTKGILERIWAVERLLEAHPELKRKFSLIQIAAPSRTKVPEYGRLKRLVDETIGRINGRFAELDWVPIVYFSKSVPRPELTAYYQAADIALVIPLRDGMNLVAKEYVASRTDCDGVVILSELAGVAEEFDEAVLVNPFDIDQVAEAIRQAIDLDVEEKRRRMQRLREKVERRDLTWWLEQMLYEFTALSAGEESGARETASAAGEHVG